MLFGLFLTLGVAVLSVALRSFQTSFAQKAGAVGILALDFSGGLFRFGKLDGRSGRGAGLALFALAGNSHPHPGVAFAEREGASSEEPALGRGFPDARRDHERDSERRIRSHQRCGLGLGRLPAVFPALLQGGGPRAGHDLPERAERSFVLLPAHFLARERRHHLDDLELSALLRVEADAAVQDQPATARPIVLAALPKPQGIPPADTRWKPA